MVRPIFYNSRNCSLLPKLLLFLIALLVVDLPTSTAAVRQQMEARRVSQQNGRNKRLSKWLTKKHRHKLRSAKKQSPFFLGFLALGLSVLAALLLLIGYLNTSLPLFIIGLILSISSGILWKIWLLKYLAGKEKDQG